MEKNSSNNSLWTSRTKVHFGSHNFFQRARCVSWSTATRPKSSDPPQIAVCLQVIIVALQSSSVEEETNFTWDGENSPLLPFGRGESTFVNEFCVVPDPYELGINQLGGFVAPSNPENSLVPVSRTTSTLRNAPMSPKVQDPSSASDWCLSFSFHPISQ